MSEFAVGDRVKVTASAFRDNGSWHLSVVYNQVGKVVDANGVYGVYVEYDDHAVEQAMREWERTRNSGRRLSMLSYISKIT